MNVPDRPAGRGRLPSLLLAVLLIFACVGIGQAEPFGVNWPVFKDSNPGELGEPSIVFVNSSFSDLRGAYYDGKTQAYWYFHNGHWAGYFVASNRGYTCWEFRGNSRVSSDWVASDRAEQLPDGRVKIGGYIEVDGNRTGNWYATFRPSQQ
jgi:hypothetical protein